MASDFTAAGLVLNIIGVIVLFLYAARTDGATSQPDRDVLCGRWVRNLGYALLALGFVGQLFGAKL